MNVFMFSKASIQTSWLTASVHILLEFESPVWSQIKNKLNQNNEKSASFLSFEHE